MSFPDAKTLAESYALTARIVHMQAQGLSTKDSLLQPPFRGNCMNWVIGHLIAGRDSALRLMELDPLWEEDILELYRSESEPVTDGERALPLERLLGDLDRSQALIDTKLAELLEADLARMVMSRGHPQALGQALAGLHWHETYHTGQLELLRQLAGTNDAII